MRNTPIICLYLILVFCISCRDKNKTLIASATLPELKRGEIITCGPQDGEMFGTVSFSASVPEKWRNDFNVGIALLHSFEYDEAEKMFAKVVDNVPDCAMAYWGIAMSNFHSLWAPSTKEELKKGAQAITIARSIKKTKREAEYIEAIARFYENPDEV